MNLNEDKAKHVTCVSVKVTETGRKPTQPEAVRVVCEEKYYGICNFMFKFDNKSPFNCK